ncbi:MAG: ABC transporter ATP-binding protein [Bacteroidota bacterium]
MLATKNLKVGFHNKNGNIVLLDLLNLSANDGELVAIIGRNGSGKTTLLRTLAGLHPPLAGDVLLDETLLTKISVQDRAKRMALVNTKRFGLGYFRVDDLVALGRHPHTGFLGFLNDNDKAEIHKACEATGIEALLEKNVNQLSDGEHQKVMIARALAQSTPLLMLDEPTAHLDLINRMEIFQLLRELSKNSNTTVVVCTHEIETALSVADRLIVLDGKGEAMIDSPDILVKNGTLENVFAHKVIEFDPVTRKFKF